MSCEHTAKRYYRSVVSSHNHGRMACITHHRTIPATCLVPDTTTPSEAKTGVDLPVHATPIPLSLVRYIEYLITTAPSSSSSASNAARIMANLICDPNRPWTYRLTSDTLRAVWKVFLRDPSRYPGLIRRLMTIASPSDRDWMWAYLRGRIPQDRATTGSWSTSTLTGDQKIMSFEDIIALINRSNPKADRRLLHPSVGLSPNDEISTGGSVPHDILAILQSSDPSVWHQIQTIHTLSDADVRRIRSELPCFLFLDNLSLVMDVLRSGSGPDRMEIVHRLERWMTDLDRQTRYRVLSQLCQWYTDGKMPDDVDIRLALLGLIIKFDPHAIPLHRYLSDLETACRDSRTETVRTAISLVQAVIDAQSTVTIPSFVHTLIQPHHDPSVITAAAWCLAHIAERLGSIAPTIDVVRTFLHVLSDHRYPLSVRTTVMSCLHRISDLPGAVEPIRSYIRILADTIHTVPDDLLQAFSEHRWPSEYREDLLYLVTTMCQTRRSHAIPTLVALLWGNGFDDQIGAILMTYASRRERDVWISALLPGVLSSVGPQVCATIQTLDPDGAYFHIITGIETVINGINGRLSVLPAFRDDLIEPFHQLIRDNPLLLSSNVMQWIWETNPIQAMAILEQMISDPEPIVRKAAVSLIVGGWDRGMDDRIMRLLMEVRNTDADPNNGDHDDIDTDVFYAVLDGFKTLHPSEARRLLGWLCATYPPTTHHDTIHSLESCWNRGIDDAIITILRSTISLSQPSIARAALHVLGGGWTGPARTVVADILSQTLTDSMHTASHVPSPRDREMIIGISEAIRSGWGCGMDRQIVHLIEQGIAWITSPTISGWESLPNIVEAWTTAIVAGSWVLSDHDLHRLLHPLYRISEHHVLSGIDQGIRYATRRK